MSPNGTSPFASSMLIGEPATVKNWCAQVSARCNCSDAGEPLLVVLGQFAQCPRCQKAYQILVIAYDATTGQALINLNVLTNEQFAALQQRGPTV